MISFTESSSWYFLPESATSWRKNWKFKFIYLQWHIHIFQCWSSADLRVPTVDRLHSDQPEWWTVPGVEVVLDHLSCPRGRVVIWVQLASCHHILLGSLLCPCFYLWVESGGRGEKSEWVLQWLLCRASSSWRTLIFRCEQLCRQTQLCTQQPLSKTGKKPCVFLQGEVIRSCEVSQTELKWGVNLCQLECFFPPQSVFRVSCSSRKWKDNFPLPGQ